MTRFMRVFYGQPNSGAQSLDPLDSPYQQFDYYEPKATVIKKALPWVLAAGFLSLCLLAVLIALIFPNGLDQSATPTSTPALTTTYKALATVGAACGVSSDCIPSAYCTGTVCACAAQLYFDTSSQTCTSRKTYGDSCSASSECEYFVYLDCLNGICDCDPSTFFWNPVTQKCEDQKGLAQACSGVSSSECFTSALSCTYYNGGPDLRCVCPTNQLTYYYSFQTQTCVPRLGQGSQCDQYGHFECVDNAWCTTFPQDSTYRCSCYPTYYWDSSTYSCRAKKQYNGTCTYTYECFDYQGQVCTSSGQCGCPTGTFWNMTNCDPLKPYAGVCNKTSDCLYTNLICTFRPEQQDYACLCPNGTYYALSNNSCVYYLNINDVCTDNYQCPINATCTFIPTTSTKTCQCASNFYYNVVGTNQCLPLKNYTSTCASDAECNSILGLYCSTANQCDCASNYYFNGNECQIQKGSDAHNYGQYCANHYECKTANPDCFEGQCN